MNFIDDVLLHHFWLVIYGVVGWWVVMWSIAKTKSDKKNGAFDWRRWWHKYYDEFIVTLFVGLSFVIFDDEVHDLIHDFTDYEFEYESYHYMLAGPVTDIFYKLVTVWKSQT